MVKTFKWLPAVLLLLAGQTWGQTARMLQSGTQNDRLAVQVGTRVNIDVLVDLQGAAAAGFSMFITVPDEFEIIDVDTVRVGKQPFTPGPLFDRATISNNILLPESDPASQSFPGQQLEYASVLGIGSDRERTGSGVAIRFSVLCLRPIENGVLLIDDSPARETKLVLSDGFSERRFRTVRGMEITVSGLDLGDIPDVILLPGQADSVQIGSLDQYLRNTLSPADSIRWSFSGNNLDSLEIEVDPLTRRVKVTPLEGWTGRRRVIWRAEEAIGFLPGELPLFQTEASSIVVNNPPLFTKEADSDGIKRDTVRIVEDEHVFTPGAPSDDVNQAFRGIDLDLIVTDPDPEALLRFAVLGFSPRGDGNQVRGQDDEQTHELLVWSAPDFGGVDSLRVFVSDGLLGGGDSLIVIVEVEPVPDPPRFILEDANLRISRGGSKTIPLQELVEDPDTPLDSLIISFDGDPGGNFTVERVNDDYIFRGNADFAGDGFFVFRVADPFDQDNLNDRLQIFITAALALPPAVFPDDLKIVLTPPGFEPALPAFTANLDDFVEDPDNQDGEISWSVPSLTRALLTVDELRNLAVRAPAGFVGFEAATLTANDPANQSDFLNLRIYSSDGQPVTGGMPDVILDRGQRHGYDLDNYYFDANNDDLDMRWEVQAGTAGFAGNFQSDDLSITIDPVTHIADFVALPSASFSTQAVIFRVTSNPEGVSAQDTVNVSIRSGDDPGGGGGLLLRPLPPLQAPVGNFAEIFNLDDLVPQDVSPDSIEWTVSRNARLGEVFVSATTRKIRALGDVAGLDTLELTARDHLGNVRVLGTTLRWFDPGLAMSLNAIPDIVFIAGQQFEGLDLDDFIGDRTVNPDSLVQWERQFTGPDDKVFLRINPDHSIFAFAAAEDTTETEVVFIARNIETGLEGRDTVRVVALDPSVAQRPLLELPDILLVSGREDSSVVLDDFLPADIGAANVAWSVSGQSITLPFIQPEAPHLLRISAIGERVGVDTLVFRADLGGGFSAVGSMSVTVVEPVDAGTLELSVLPNPLQNEFIDVFVVARRPIEGAPIVVRNFAGVDSTVAVSQAEDDLINRGVLVWSGAVQLRPGANGRVFFTAQAFTALGTNVSDTASVSVAAAVAGKALALRHGAIGLELGADALPAGTQVLMQSATSVGIAAKSADALQPLLRVDLYPAKELKAAAFLRVDSADQSVGIYRNGPEGARYLGPASGAAVSRLGRFMVMRDGTKPDIDLLGVANRLRFALADRGSGIDSSTVRLWVDGLERQGRFVGDEYRWEIEPEVDRTLDAETGQRLIELSLQDRAGNTANWKGVVQAQVRPQVSHLEPNYPNPFNPETQIPFQIATTGRVMVGVYSSGGQLVRQLLDRHMEAGRYRLRWDGRDAAGHRVASGVYLYRLRAGGGVDVRRMTLLK
jgi:hypothetical protein